MMSNNQPIPDLTERRYIIGFDPADPSGRVDVFVVDKLAQKIVYHVNTSAKFKTEVEHRQKTYKFIKDYYGKDNCIPPKQMSILLFI